MYVLLAKLRKKLLISFNKMAVFKYINASEGIIKTSLP